jgi:hypothetical protein
MNVKCRLGWGGGGLVMSDDRWMNMMVNEVEDKVRIDMVWKDYNKINVAL